MFLSAFIINGSTYVAKFSVRMKVPLAYMIPGDNSIFAADPSYLSFEPGEAGPESKMTKVLPFMSVLGLVEVTVSVSSIAKTLVFVPALPV